MCSIGRLSATGPRSFAGMASGRVLPSSVKSTRSSMRCVIWEVAVCAMAGTAAHTVSAAAAASDFSPLFIWEPRKESFIANITGLQSGLPARMTNDASRVPNNPGKAALFAVTALCFYPALPQQTLGKRHARQAQLLHRRQMGRAYNSPDARRDQPRERGGVCAHQPRIEGGRRQGGGGGAPRVRDLFALDEGRAARAPAEDLRHISEALWRDGGNDLARDGRTARALESRPGRNRSRASGRD